MFIIHQKTFPGEPGKVLLMLHISAHNRGEEDEADQHEAHVDSREYNSQNAVDFFSGVFVAQAAEDRIRSEAGAGAIDKVS